LGKDVAWEEDVFPDMDSGQKDWAFRKVGLEEKMGMTRKWVGEEMDP
jgi:hypothetical protein